MDEDGIVSVIQETPDVGQMSDFIISDGASTQTIEDGNTVTFAVGTGL